MVTPEFGTSKDPLKALTCVPVSVFRWTKRAWRRRFPPLHHNRSWAPVLQTDHDDHEGSVGVLFEEALSQPGGVGVEGGSDDFEICEEEGGDAAGEGEGRGVVIKGLRKEFGSKVAVAGLDLHLRVGDITCLLGHNGAGE